MPLWLDCYCSCSSYFNIYLFSFPGQWKGSLLRFLCFFLFWLNLFNGFYWHWLHQYSIVLLALSHSCVLWYFLSHFCFDFIFVSLTFLLCSHCADIFLFLTMQRDSFTLLNFFLFWFHWLCWLIVSYCSFPFCSFFILHYYALNRVCYKLCNTKKVKQLRKLHKNEQRDQLSRFSHASICLYICDLVPWFLRYWLKFWTHPFLPK